MGRDPRAPSRDGTQMMCAGLKSRTLLVEATGWGAGESSNRAAALVTGRQQQERHAAPGPMKARRITPRRRETHSDQAEQSQTVKRTDFVVCETELLRQNWGKRQENWPKNWILKLCLQMYRTDFWTLWEKARVGCFERIALKHVYYQG